MPWYRVTVQHTCGGQNTVDVKASDEKTAKKKGLSKARGVLGRLDEHLGHGGYDPETVRTTRI